MKAALRILLMLTLMPLLLWCASCAIKKKAVNRYKEQSNTTLQINQLEALKKDIELLKKEYNVTQLNARKFTKKGKTTYTPIDENKDATININGDSITLNNVRATFETSEEDSNINLKDSLVINQKLTDNSTSINQINLDQNTKGRKKGRQTQSNVKRTSTWVTIGIGTGIFFIIALLGWYFYRK